MTEAEWLVATDPTPMLEFLRGKASDRKLRLYLDVCCRQVWEYIRDPRARAAIIAGALLADGRIDETARAAAETALFDARDEYPADVECAPDLEAALLLVSRWPCEAAHTGYSAAALAGLAMDSEEAFDGLDGELQSEQCDLLRDIFGNPFSPVAVDPEWLTSTVVALAAGIYADRAFDRLPILADALQDAGCDHPDVLAHCRGDGPHVRGCWVVDLVLGKA